jgi:GLPGLI family protein
MKAFLSLLLILSTAFAFSQKVDATGIVYIGTYKLFTDEQEPFQEAFALMIHDDETFFTSTIQMKRDTIFLKRQNNSLTDKEAFNHPDLKLKTYHNYYIKTVGDSLFYNEIVGSKEYIYSEQINFDWQLSNETKEISGFKCFKATTNYAGRYWEAWYTLEVPLNAGPYKFKGLPGLIIKCQDLKMEYIFEYYSTINKKNVELKKVVNIIPQEDIINTSRINFNILKDKYYSMTEEEHILDLKSRGIILRPSLGQSETMRDVKKESRISTKRNFIETDY